MKIKYYPLFILALVLCHKAVNAQVRLPGFFTDNMVLQRDRAIKIWGWADPKEAVEVDFAGRIYRTKAGKRGEWMLEMGQMAFGGPYELTVRGENNSVSYGNILIGDVWLSSGQSNMEWPLALLPGAEGFAAEAYYPEIRMLNVPNNIHRLPQEDLAACWDICTPVTVGDHSAVSYFFARELYRELSVPIGIVNSSWGGSEIEAWIGPDSYQKLPPEFRTRFQSDLTEDMDRYLARRIGSMDDYIENRLDDPGMKERWYEEITDRRGWGKMQLPCEWGGTPLAHIDGLVWFSYTFELPAEVAKHDAVLHLGMIDDHDITWVNSVEIGRTNGYTSKRKYHVPAGVLRPGPNNITVRVKDDLASGGFLSPAGDFCLELVGTPSSIIPLSGKWDYMPTVTGERFYLNNIGPGSFYSSAYNAMIHPLTEFPIKGIIWYQGEANTNDVRNYGTLFTTLIDDWRGAWGLELPFYWVQLPNFMGKDRLPSESEWAGLREAQARALYLPCTGQAVTIDIGEADNLHPGNKWDVGRRLALCALNRTYGMDVVCSGPTYRSMELKNGKAHITFDLHGSDIVVRNKYGYIEGFAVAGADRNFVWAKASLDGSKVSVWSDSVPDPVAVRFAWGNNPDMNIFNSEGLPAAPFRTDDW